MTKKTAPSVKQTRHNKTKIFFKLLLSCFSFAVVSRQTKNKISLCSQCLCGETKSALGLQWIVRYHFL
jgi:hypothetical protein